jgi:apolipoprotein N-acyltransferase
MFFGPRFGYLIYWIVAPVRVNLTLASLNFPFLVSTLGLIFAPWTLLMWVSMFPMDGFDWIWIGFGVMADMTAYVTSFHNRKRAPGYPANDPFANM